MKTILGMMLLMTSLTAAAAPAGHMGDDGQSLDLFYASLSPRGEWIAIEGGSYAWRPHGVEQGWRPYWNGHWVWSEQGWYWWSPEPWAWATYHYGRWYYDDVYGWVWIPGYDWAPAWVEWRYGGDVIGWAPLGPYALFSAPVGIRYERHWVTPVRWWIFVGCGAFTRHEVWREAYPPGENDRFIHGSRSIGSIRYTGGRMVVPGPDRVFIERRANARVESVRLVDVSSDKDPNLSHGGEGDRIHVYRPPINRPPSGRDDRAPANVIHERQSLRLDPRGMDQIAPSNPDPGIRQQRPEIRRVPKRETDRQVREKPQWRSERPAHRGEVDRPRRVEQRDRPAARPGGARGTVREGKREGK